MLKHHGRWLWFDRHNISMEFLLQSYMEKSNNTQCGSYRSWYQLHLFSKLKKHLCALPEKQSWDSEWCRLAYWEQARRVGRQFGVRPRVVDVFGGGGGTCGSDRYGLCLDSLGDCSAPGTEQVIGAYSHIGNKLAWILIIPLEPKKISTF